LLLHRDLEIESVDISGAPLVVDVGDGFKPRHFWKRPDYERLEAYSAARELTIHPPATGWPNEPRITLRYAGAVYDSLRPPEVAYGRGFETTSGLIGERGAYLSGATFWIPWSGEGLFRYRLEAIVPSGWESLSQGTWAGRRVTGDGRVESVWVVDNPMTEAYFIAGPYVVREAPHGDVKAYTFTYENTPEELCQTYLDATGDYLDLYEEMIGPYPFDKFAMVENWWQTGYGMPSFTLLGDRVIRLPFIVHTSYGHEILHNWWGNGVFVDIEKGNWCEGLTTYLADYSYKERENVASAREYRLKQLQAYLDYASSGEHDFALRRFTERESASTQAVGYGKTMMVFHMTRQLLGDDVFFDGLRRLYNERCFEEASWDDIVGSFEVVSGRSLEAWFEQWIGRPGAPVLSVAR
ncbi:MAG: M1 family peptidase, partial [Candidatus Krumholzibacteria bacterium]|nr:M1 family peptidase [Candidatus Krumholzibacteria bacterium]